MILNGWQGGGRSQKVFANRDRRQKVRTGMTSQVVDLAPQIKISGRMLAALLKKASATRKALVDNDLRTGRMVVIGMTADQSRRFSGTPRGYQCTVANLAQHERERLRNGWATISDYHNGDLKKRPSDAAIERCIKRWGADRVLQVLDRMTAPTLVAAE
jgi:hypothetical protein